MKLCPVSFELQRGSLERNSGSFRLLVAWKKHHPFQKQYVLTVILYSYIFPKLLVYKYVELFKTYCIHCKTYHLVQTWTLYISLKYALWTISLKAPANPRKSRDIFPFQNSFGTSPNEHFKLRPFQSRNKFQSPFLGERNCWPNFLNSNFLSKQRNWEGIFVDPKKNMASLFQFPTYSVHLLLPSCLLFIRHPIGHGPNRELEDEG